MNQTEARAWAAGCRNLLARGDVTGALARMQPVLAGRTPFTLLDLAGRIIAEAAAANPAGFTALLDGLAATAEIGAWPLLGSALAAACLPRDMPQAFSAARRYILQADVWHATDAIGERVLGQGLCSDLDAALALLANWREDESPWLRRAVGVAVHFYTKRERQRPERVARLLDLLEPLFEERDLSAIKGIGWGLKTIGRFYPDLLVPWLRRQVAARKPRCLMLRKATEYLPAEVKAEFL
jgi:3-methyladenine DNA glycosylase AlkD